MRYKFGVPMLLLASSVFAQSPADITAQGGKKLSKEEIQALLVGASVSFLSPAGGDFTLGYDKNGSISGSIMTKGGAQMLGGTWKVDDSGRYCESVSTPRGGFNGCYDLYSLGGATLFVSEDGKTYRRRISR